MTDKTVSGKSEWPWSFVFNKTRQFLCYIHFYVFVYDFVAFVFYIATIFPQFSVKVRANPVHMKPSFINFNGNIYNNNFIPSVLRWNDDITPRDTSINTINATIGSRTTYAMQHFSFVVRTKELKFKRNLNNFFII